VQAARAIAELNEVSSRELAPAIVCLQLFLTSRKTVMRFAAVRTLNMVSMTKPSAVQACNLDLEQLMSEPNRSIATYAITTLLKTGSELSIERLLKQISNFMSDIAGAQFTTFTHSPHFWGWGAWLLAWGVTAFACCQADQQLHERHRAK
jgi:coatomer protein complex subunit gamma